MGAIESHLWSKPSTVLSDYTGEIQEEDAIGRFHASLAFTRKAFEQVGGWPLSLRGDFDQQLIARLNSVGIPGDPCQLHAPAYVFRWGSTGAYHGQASMLGPADESWYEAVGVETAEQKNFGDELKAKLDIETRGGCVS